MSKVEHPMEALRQFLPEGSFELVVEHIHRYKVHLTVTKARRSVLGDYRHAFRGTNHRISVNGNLNKYEFLITLLHEIAHLLTYEQFGNRVDAHGKEWKRIYGDLLRTFVQYKIFPPPIENALHRSIMDPAATANGETELLLVLRQYEKRPEGVVMVQEVPTNGKFRTKDGRVFQKMEKLRKRFRCKEITTGLIYLFSPVYEVKVVSGE